MRKISGTIQRRNDQQVGILGADLHTASLPAGEDHYPNSDGRGLATRFINPTGLTAWTAHFRPGETTGPGEGSLAAFAWQGAPFTTPASINYSRQSDYLAWYHSSAARFFLSCPITNSAAAWQNRAIYGRLAAAYNGRIGVRLDDGTDNNYAEVLLDASANNGGQVLTFRYRAGGGAVTTVTGSTYPVTQLFTLRLLCVWDGANYSVYGYPVNEGGDSVNVTAFNTPAIAWAPAAGRVGILLDTTAASNYQVCDWFYTDFG